MSIDRRIRALRDHLELNQLQFGERVGVSDKAVSQWEMPERQGQKRRPPRPSKERLVKIAQEFGARLEWLMSGAGPMLEDGEASERSGSGQTVQVVGYVGAGAEVIPFDDHEMGAGLETVEVDFPVRPGTVAVIVRGDSQYPIFEDGDLIGYMEDSADPNTLIGKICIVKLADGRTFVKRLKRGSEDGLFTLTSANARDIEDVEIEWARRYRFRIPADEWHSLAKLPTT